MIHYLKGDATKPQRNPAMILSIVNDVGLYGAGFTASLDKRWPIVGDEYRRLMNSKSPPALGDIASVKVRNGIVVINMWAQHGVGRNKQRVDYVALEQCLENVARYIRKTYLGYSIHIPRIGCGLGGGDWDVVETLIDTAFYDICDVFVYTFKKKIKKYKPHIYKRNPVKYPAKEEITKKGE